MRIVYILAGAGGMYCGACNRDMDLVTGIQKQGYDIQLIPLYTPLRSDIEEPPKMNRIFYGGILTFLEQKLKFFRHTPKIIDFFVDNKFLLKILSKFTIETKPHKLGGLTVSVLKGEDGHQQKELNKLMECLHLIKPDIVHITNSMLSGIAPSLKQAFNIPVVCSLQGEEEFLFSLGEPYSTEAKKLVAVNAKSIDMFIATYQEYANEMIDFLQIDAAKIKVIKPGVNTNKYIFSPKNLPSSTRKIKIGYLSRIAPEKGLDILIEAFCTLHCKYPDIELHIAGQVYDKKFWAMLSGKIKTKKLEQIIIYHGELNFKQKKDFLASSTIFCVPSKFKESRGIAILEALATNTPVVVPKLGIYNNIIAETGGGLLAEPGNNINFAEKIENLITDQNLYQTCQNNIRLSFTEKYNSQKMILETINIYKQLLNTKESLE